MSIFDYQLNKKDMKNIIDISTAQEEIIDFSNEDFAKEPRSADKVRAEFSELMSSMGYSESSSQFGTVSYSRTDVGSLTQYFFNIELVGSHYVFKHFSVVGGRIEATVLKEVRGVGDLPTRQSPKTTTNS